MDKAFTCALEIHGEYAEISYILEMIPEVQVVNLRGKTTENTQNIVEKSMIAETESGNFLENAKLVSEQNRGEAVDG
nr:hypothetical protein Iba_chr13eCG9080 [Ipomoea batatas]